jgi:predicted DNA-binding protein (UPF0251 family)
MLALLRYRRPGFDDYTFEQQLDLLDRHRSVVNAFLKEQREHVAFLEYGTREGIPRSNELARDQVKAAVLSDVEGLRHREIANRVGVDTEGRSYDIYAKIPAVTKLIKEGRRILEEASGEMEWRKRAEWMKVEAKRYRSLSEEEKEIEALAESTGWSIEEARSCYQRNPEEARFLATPLHF